MFYEREGQRLSGELSNKHELDETEYITKWYKQTEYLKMSQLYQKKKGDKCTQNCDGFKRKRHRKTQA